MKKSTDSIYVRIVDVTGMRITVSTTHPGDFAEIGEPPLAIEGVEIMGKGKAEESAGDMKSHGAYRLVFIAKSGQDLKRIQIHKRYKLTSH